MLTLFKNNREQKSTLAHQGKASVFMKRLTFLAYTGTLLVSVPHIAWMFDLFEQGDTGSLLLLGIPLHTISSYAFSLVIDSIIMCLSYWLIARVEKAHFLTWVVLLSLVAMSYFGNFSFYVAHYPKGYYDFLSTPILMGNTTIGYVAPLILSSLPLFSICFSIMLKKLTTEDSNGLEVLQEKVLVMERERELKAQLATLQRERVKHTLIGGVSLGRELLSTVFSSDGKQALSPVHQEVVSVVEEKEVVTDKIAVIPSSDPTATYIPAYRRNTTHNER